MGWLASIIMRTNAQQGILLNIVVGIVGAFIGGMIFSGGNINQRRSSSTTFPGLAGRRGHSARDRQPVPSRRVRTSR